MSVEVRLLDKPLPALITLEWPLPCVNPLMGNLLKPCCENFLTKLTLIFCVSCMFPHVILEHLFGVKWLTTIGTEKWLLSSVWSVMFMIYWILSHKSLVASLVWTKIFEVSSVSCNVSLQGILVLKTLPTVRTQVFWDELIFKHLMLFKMDCATDYLLHINY